MSERASSATIQWCLKHEREVTNRFVAAVCPNEPGCLVVIRVVENGSSSERQQ